MAAGLLRHVRRAFAFLVLAVVAGLPARCPAQRIAFTPPDPGLTAGLESISLNAAVPDYNPDDFKSFEGSGGRSSIDGLLVRPSAGRYVPMRGVTVYLIPARPFTRWFVALATANAAGVTKTAPAIDGRLRSSFLLHAQTDGAGGFRFDDLLPGPYYVFAVVNQRFGPPVVSERVERGWDGRGHGADVAVPVLDIPNAHLDQWVYACGYDLSNLPAPWHLGLVRPARQLRDGRAVTMP